MKKKRKEIVKKSHIGIPEPLPIIYIPYTIYLVECKCIRTYERNETFFHENIFAPQFRIPGEGPRLRN